MQRQGGFFGKSRHAPVSAIDIKRNNEQTMNHRPPGVGPESATGGNMTPLGNANLTPLGKPNPGSRQNLGTNDTQPHATAPISHEPTHLAPKAAVNAQVNNDTNQRVGNESTDKERDANRPRKSVMRKVRPIRISLQSRLEAEAADCNPNFSFINYYLYFKLDCRPQLFIPKYARKTCMATRFQG